MCLRGNQELDSVIENISLYQHLKFSGIHNTKGKKKNPSLKVSTIHWEIGQKLSLKAATERFYLQKAIITQTIST